MSQLNPVDLSDAGAMGSNPEATPVAVNGIVYLPAVGNSVLALDGATGALHSR